MFSVSRSLERNEGGIPRNDLSDDHELTDGGDRRGRHDESLIPLGILGKKEQMMTRKSEDVTVFWV